MEEKSNCASRLRIEGNSMELLAHSKQDGDRLKFFVEVVINGKVVWSAEQPQLERVV